MYREDRVFADIQILKGDTVFEHKHTAFFTSHSSQPRCRSENISGDFLPSLLLHSGLFSLCFNGWEFNKQLVNSTKSFI